MGQDPGRATAAPRHGTLSKKQPASSSSSAPLSPLSPRQAATKKKKHFEIDSQKIVRAAVGAAQIGEGHASQSRLSASPPLPPQPEHGRAGGESLGALDTSASFLPRILRPIKQISFVANAQPFPTTAPFEETRYGRYRRNTMLEREHQRQLENLRKSKLQLKYRQRNCEHHQRLWERGQQNNMLGGHVMQMMQGDYVLPVRVATPPPDFSLYEPARPNHARTKCKKNQRQKKILRKHRQRPRRIEQLTCPTGPTGSRKIKNRQADDDDQEDEGNDDRSSPDSADEDGTAGNGTAGKDSCVARSSSGRRTKIRSLGRRKMTKLARKTIADALASPRSELRNRSSVLGLNLNAFGDDRNQALRKKRDKTRRRRALRTRSHSHVLIEEEAPRRTSRVKDALLTNQKYRTAPAPPRFAITNWNPLQDNNNKTQMPGPRGGMRYRVPESTDCHIDYPPAKISPKGEHFQAYFF